MAFAFRSGNIFDSHPSIVINTANCVGIMGAGVAKSVAERFPSVARDFRQLCGLGLSCDGMPDRALMGRKFDPLPSCLELGRPCDIHRVRPGHIHFVRTGDSTTPWVGHLVTKRHWNSASRLEDVESGIIALARAIERNQSPTIQTVAMPAPGCANGGLNWERDVRPLVVRHLQPVAEASRHIVHAYQPMPKR